MIYAAEVKESHRRTVYVEADTPQEALRLARDPSEWWDAADPDTTADVYVYASSVKELPPEPSSYIYRAIE